MLEKNKQTALASLQGVNDHNTDAVYQNATADVTDSGDGNGPAVKGIDSCKAYFKMFLAAFPDIKGKNFMAFADGNHVAVVGNWSGTFKGQMMGMKPTGKSFKFRDVDIFTFNDEGKITDHQNVQSMETIMSQIGASMKK
jgi:predicted ester cyclase